MCWLWRAKSNQNLMTRDYNWVDLEVTSVSHQRFVWEVVTNFTLFKHVYWLKRRNFIITHFDAYFILPNFFLIIKNIYFCTNSYCRIEKNLPFCDLIIIAVYEVWLHLLHTEKKPNFVNYSCFWRLNLITFLLV